MSYFQEFEYEIKINIFKYVEFPSNLARTCRSWSKIASCKSAKAEWLIERYGKAHALFHAVRLGPTFIDKPVCQILLARKVLVSKYFTKGLLKNFGKPDQKLIELRAEHNIIQPADTINIEPLWASDLPIDVFIYLLGEECKHVNEDSKNNDMELVSSSIEIPQPVPINNENDDPLINGISFY